MDLHFGLAVDPLLRLRIPLTRTCWIGGQTPDDLPDVPRAHLIADGVLVRRPGSLGFYSSGLQKTVWMHTIAGSSGAVPGPAETILIKPETSVVTQYEVRTGAIKRSVETRSAAILIGSTGHNFLLMSLNDKMLIAFDWSGKEVWRWQYDEYCHVLCLSERYIVVERGTKIHGLDAISGKDLWQFEAEQTGDRGPQDRSNVLTSGFPSVVDMEGQLLTIVGDGRVFKRDPATGQLIKQGQTPFRGPYQVTKESIFIFNKLVGEFTEYNHQLMQEVDRQDLKKEMQRLFQKELPTVNALLVSEESIIWTTMSGKIMGTERHSQPGKERIVWSDYLGPVLMPIAVPPKAGAGYMYYSAISLKPEVKKGLVCYKASSSG